MLADLLLERDRQSQPWQAGVIGAGTFGARIIARTSRIQGIRFGAVTDPNIDRAIVNGTR
jgi:predicted homoserine dehydrogenase-like protein